MVLAVSSKRSGNGLAGSVVCVYAGGGGWGTYFNLEVEPIGVHNNNYGHTGVQVGGGRLRSRGRWMEVT